MNVIPTPKKTGKLEIWKDLKRYGGNPGSIIYEILEFLYFWSSFGSISVLPHVRSSPVLILEQVIAGKERLPDCDCLWLGKIWLDITNLFVTYLPDFIWCLYLEHIFRCIFRGFVTWVDMLHRVSVLWDRQMMIHQVNQWHDGELRRGLTWANWGIIPFGS